MKIKHYLLTGASFLSLLTLSSCFDKDYDLSDIDTTSRFRVNDLVVPIRLDALTLDQVLDLDDDSEIKTKTDADGNTFYAIEKEGSFSSDPIDVSTFTASKPNITPSSNTLDLTPVSAVAGLIDEVSAYYEIADKSDPTHFETTSNDVDEAIKDIKKLGVSSKFDIKISISGSGVSSIYDNVKYEGVKIQFPKGLTATPSQGNYNPATGILDLSSVSLVPDSRGSVNIVMDITAIDTKVANVTFVAKAGEKGTFTFEDDVKIEEGRVNIYGVDPAELPAQITFTSSPTLQAINVNTFTGRIQYDVDDFDIDPVDLSNIPDALNGDGTEITLGNPQIYLSINNPMHDYNVGFQTGFSITSVRTTEGETNTNTFSIDNGTFATPSPQKEDNKFVLAPAVPATYYEGYDETSTFVPFSSLGQVLTGVGGIPQTIEVDAVKPQIYEQDIENFRLGEKLDKVEGDYVFYAPLQLADNSLIAYTDTIDDWNDEDVDAITIEQLTLSFDASSEIPFDLKIKVYPIDKDGKRIPDAVSSTAHLTSMAKNEPVNISITGLIQHLDGLIIEAKVDVDNKGEEIVLDPNLKIDIKNSKATVTGYYEKEL